MDALPAELLPHRSQIVREAQFRFGIPAPLAAIAAQIAQESGFDATANSRVGARGLLQIMPKTADFIGESIGERGDPADPQWAIRAGVWYMRYLYDRVAYQRECDRYGAALSAYNGGLGWHNRRQAAARDPQDFWGSVRTINPGITAANQRENERYSWRIVYTLQARFRAMGGKLVCIS